MSFSSLLVPAKRCVEWDVTPTITVTVTITLYIINCYIYLFMQLSLMYIIEVVFRQQRCNYPLPLESVKSLMSSYQIFSIV